MNLRPYIRQGDGHIIREHPIPGIEISLPCILTGVVQEVIQPVASNLRSNPNRIACRTKAVGNLGFSPQATNLSSC